MGDHCGQAQAGIMHCMKLLVQCLGLGMALLAHFAVPPLGHLGNNYPTEVFIVLSLYELP